MRFVQGWVDKGDEAQPDLDEIEEDEEYLEQAEKFEARYNHRFEVSRGYFSTLHVLALCMYIHLLQPQTIHRPATCLLSPSAQYNNHFVSAGTLFLCMLLLPCSFLTSLPL